jgi:putative membrane protein
MTSAIAILLLVMYVAYHMMTPQNLVAKVIKYVYYFIKLPIVLSIAIIPMVLTYVRALAANFESHKKISRITFPIWLYVAVTGVIVY